MTSTAEMNQCTIFGFLFHFSICFPLLCFNLENCCLCKPAKWFRCRYSVNSIRFETFHNNANWCVIVKKLNWFGFWLSLLPEKYRTFCVCILETLRMVVLSRLPLDKKKIVNAPILNFHCRQMLRNVQPSNQQNETDSNRREDERTSERFMKWKWKNDTLSIQVAEQTDALCSTAQKRGCLCYDYALGLVVVVILSSPALNQLRG